jgi:hypothetical protein
MKLRTTMVDEPDPGPPTTPMVPQVTAKKSWFKSEPKPARKKNVSEAQAGYVTDEKPSQAKTWMTAAVVAAVLIGAQVFTSGDSGMQVAVATGYVYAGGFMVLWLLWQAFSENIQRLGIFVGMPICWAVIHSMTELLPVMVYFILFTVFAYLAYLIDYIVRETKSRVFKVASLAFMVSAITEFYFLIADERFMQSLHNFPTIKLVIDPIVAGGAMLRNML